MANNISAVPVTIEANGNTVIPKDFCSILGVQNGGKVMFVYENGAVRIVNPALYAIEQIRKELEGEAEKAGLYTDEDIVKLCKEVRREMYNENTD